MCRRRKTWAFMAFSPNGVRPQLPVLKHHGPCDLSHLKQECDVAHWHVAAFAASQYLWSLSD